MSMSDLGLVFPMIIFIVLVAALSSFFIMDPLADNVWNQVTIPGQPPYWSDDPALPIDKEMFYNNSIVNATNASDPFQQTDWTRVIWGTNAILGAGILCVLLPPLWPVALGVGFLGGLGIISSNQQLMDSIPIFGTLAKALDYTATMLESFIKMVTFSITGLATVFPLVAWIIGIPIGFFFFIFILRFFRGQ